MFFMLFFSFGKSCLKIIFKKKSKKMMIILLYAYDNNQKKIKIVTWLAQF